MKHTRRVALVMAMSFPDSENRLKTQLIGLQKMNFEIHTLGFGEKAIDGVQRHFEIKATKRDPVNAMWRLLINLTRQPKERFKALTLPRIPIGEMASISYDLIINHDLELLPLLTQKQFIPDSFRSAVTHVDLHEHHSFSGEEVGPLSSIWRFFGQAFPAYHSWLLAQLSSTMINLTTVVNRSIGAWYLDNGYFSKYLEIINAAPQSHMPLIHRHEEALRFIHHGKFSKRRGLENLVLASLEFRPGDTLNFMLTGNSKEILEFRKWAEAINPNISFRNPVLMEEVTKTLSEFDVELIYFEPTSQNMQFTLPNKFFEALQGNLGIISGPSPELIRYADEFGCGLFSERWGVNEFAAVVRNLNREKVELLRHNAQCAANKLHSNSEAEKLVKEWDKLLTSGE